MATERRQTNPHEEVYVDNAMTWLLGDHPKARLLTAFVGKEYRELTASEVCDLAGIDRGVFDEHVGNLLDFGVVTVEESDDEEVYRLNADSDLARDLKQRQFDLLSVVGDGDG